jgi:hypothetical protein
MKSNCTLDMRRTLAALAAALALVAGCEDDSTGSRDLTAPARITDLAVTAVTATDITLEWTASGDDGDKGTASSYQLKRSGSAIDASNFAAATTVAGVPGPGGAGSAELFTVTGLDSNLTYYFALRAVDEAGNASPVSNNALWQPSGVPQHYVKDIPPFKDNTMFEEGDFSNGMGEYVFAGTNAGGESPPYDARRALLAFAVPDSIAAGAVIDSVRLTLRMSRTIVGDHVVSLHRLTADWGEGISDASGEEGAGDFAATGDATWTHRFFNTDLWTAPGGDFVGTASAQQTVGAIAFYTWSSAQMAADVQSWLDTPAGNFGWIVIGDESVERTAKRFDSLQHRTAANRPVLTVYYTVP